MVQWPVGPGLKRLLAYFYRLDSGREPVREWLRELEPKDRKAIRRRHQGRGVLLAYRHAARSSAGPRIVGSPERFATGPDRAGSFLRRTGTHAAAAARRMHTSRAALDRLLDPEYDAVTLSTLRKAAAAVGRELLLELR